MTSTTFTLGKADHVIEDVAGCGLFQVLITFLVMSVGNSIMVFTLNFMAFGSYNPGWKCQVINNSMKLMGNISYSDFNFYTQSPSLQISVKQNATLLLNITNQEEANETADIWYYSDDVNQCPIFDECDNIQFNPDSATIVSEWSLLCGQGWIISFITSIQMVGVMLGCLIAGHCGDRFGRKRTFCAGTVGLIIFNIISIFSPYWEVYAAFLFILGVFGGINMSVYLVYILEFIPVNWRTVVESFPGWAIISVFNNLVIMYVRDWRYIQIAAALIGSVGFLLILWLPESLRWLEVKELNKRLEKDMKIVLKMNGKAVPNFDHQEILEKKASAPGATVDKNIYDIRSLFRKEYRKVTLFITLPWIIAYAIGNGIIFGIRALKGDFYLNLILLDLIIIPFCLIPMIVPNIIGRKRSAVLFSTLSGLCFLAAGCFELLGSETSRLYAVSTFVFTAWLLLDMWSIVLVAITMEVYPTVIRSLGTSWGNAMARVGAIIAPFVIPSDPSQYHISYFMVGSIIMISCMFVVKLPETNKIRLKDAYESRITQTDDEVNEDTEDIQL